MQKHKNVNISVTVSKQTKNIKNFLKQKDKIFINLFNNNFL